MTESQIMIGALVVALLFPSAILLDKFRRNGGVAIMAAGALAMFATLWAVGINALATGVDLTSAQYSIFLSYFGSFVGVCGVLLLFAAWALALAKAAHMQDWRWFWGLVGAVFVTVTLYVYGVTGPDNGCFFSDSPCVALNPVMEAVWFGLSGLTGPAALLVFALRAPSGQPR